MLTPWNFIRAEKVRMTVRPNQLLRAWLVTLIFVLWTVSAAVAQVSFAPAVNYNAHTTPYAVGAGDFNGDGKVDLAVPNFGSNDVSILLGNGNGTFGAPTNFTVGAGTGPQYIAVGDFNGDGKLDLVTANMNGNSISVLLGNGNGTFQAPVTYAAGNGTRDVVVADLRGIGKLDIVATNANDTVVSVFLGNGDGTFQPQVTYFSGNSTRAVVVADFNKDGKLDLAVTNTNDNTVSILLGNGDGTFGAANTFNTGNAPWFLAAGDFNGDGNLDLAVPNQTDNTVGILLGNGDGTFQAQTTYAAGNAPHTISVYDFNGDGILDLCVGNSGSNNVSVLLGNGDGSFQAPTNFTVGQTPKGMYLGDLNGDGKQDIAIANTAGASNNVSVLLNTTSPFPNMTLTAPASVTAGMPFSVTVRMMKGGVPYGAYRGTVHFTSSDPQAVLPSNYTFTAADNGVHTFTNLLTLKTAGSRTVTATDTLNAANAGTVTITVNPGPASVFVVTAPAAATAGTAFSVTVTAKDAYGNVATGYTGTVHFTSTDGQAVLPANYTFVAGDAGVHTFNVTLKSAGNQTVTATDTVTGTLTGTSSAVATTAAAASLFVVTAPAAATAGTAFSVTVTAKDAYGNTAKTYTGTVHFTSTDGQAVLPANYTFVAADNGVHTFNNAFTLKTSGNQTITGTDTVTSSITGTSGTIAVSPYSAGPLHYVVTAPAAATAGTAFSVTVTAKDQYNNTVPTYTGTVHFTSTDGQAVLPGNYTFVAADNGVHTFNNGFTLKTAGNQTVTGTDTVTASITGTSGTIVVSPNSAGPLHYVVTAPAAATAGTAFSVTVTVKDQFNNTVTTYAGIVHFTSTDGQATLPANSTLTNGTGTFSVTLKTAGNQTITGTDTVTSSITGTSGAVNVSAASSGPLHLAVVAPPTATAGTAFNITVTAQDQFNNTVTTYAGTVHFTSTDGQATLPANSTLTNGTGTFSVTLKTAGNQTITGTDTVTSSITGTSGAISVKTSTSTAVGSSANPSLSGTAVTFTATVTPSSATGTVTFYDGGTSIGSSTLSGGTASVTVTLSTLGNHPITAQYSGDANDSGSTSPVLMQSVKANSTTSVSSSVNPSVFGQSVTFTAAVTGLPPGSSTPTGNVTFMDGATTLGSGALSGSGVSATATFTTTALPVGVHNIIAVFPGDFTYLTSTSSVLTQTVNLASTTTAITNSSLNPSTYGQLVTFTASVTAVAPGAGTPTGTITFKDGGATIGTATLNGSGVATLTTSALSAGNHSITAVYGGDSGFATSASAGFGQTVNQSNTSSTLGASTGSSVYGQPVTFTVTVVAVAPGSGVPTGTVQFKDAGSPIGSPVTLNASGQAVYVTSTLSLGSHPISGAYSGDTNFIVSASNTVVEVVNQAGTSAAVNSSANPSVYGQSVTFMATVSPVAPSTGVPTGTVTFRDNGVAMGSPVTLDVTASAMFTPPGSLSVGSHNITVFYSGDTNYGGSFSPVYAQTVNQANTTTSVTSSMNPAPFGQSITFTATVAAVAPGAGTPTGTVTFYDGATNIGMGTLNGSGVATLPISTLTVGNHTITATYAGDTNFNGSNGPLNTNPQVINPGAHLVVTTTHSPNVAALGGKLTFTTTVANQGPSPANVTFAESFAGTNYLVSVTTSMGSCSGSGPVNCNLGSMNNGQTATITVVLTPYNLTRAIVATATATGDVPDPNPGSNTCNDTAQVRFLPIVH